MTETETVQIATETGRGDIPAAGREKGSLGKGGGDLAGKANASYTFNFLSLFSVSNLLYSVHIV